MKPLNLNFPDLRSNKPFSQNSFRPKSNPPYLMHQMALKSKPITAKPSHQITPLIDDPRTHTSFPQPRRRKDYSFMFSALDHRMKLLTKGVYSNRKSLIRSPKQMLNSLTAMNFNTKHIYERKKRDLLTLTGGLTSTNLKNLMNFKEPNETNYYSLKIGSDSQFKNYKYQKPNSLCEQIFMKETIRKASFQQKPRILTRDLENCIDNLKEAKEKDHIKENQDFSQENLDNIDHLEPKLNNRDKSQVLKDGFEESMEEILEYLENTLDFEAEIKENSSKFETSQPNKDKIEVFLRSGNCKGPWMLKEFSSLWSLSKKVLKFLDKMKKPQQSLINPVFSGKNLLLSIVKFNFSGFKGRNRLINDRVLLALDINPMKPLFLLSIEKYFKIVRLAFLGNQSQEELIDFSIRYFRVSREINVEKEEFFRILKVLTEQIDERIQENYKEKRKSLFDNFLENFYMTGVLRKEENFVDFKRFKEVYKNYQMNIYDLVDLIFGRI